MAFIELDIELISGDYPKNFNSSNDSEIEVIVSREESEKLNNLQVGSTKIIYPYWEDEIQEITIRVSGIYDRAKKNSDFWEFYDINFTQQDSTFSFAGSTPQVEMMDHIHPSIKGSSQLITKAIMI